MKAAFSVGLMLVLMCSSCYRYKFGCSCSNLQNNYTVEEIGKMTIEEAKIICKKRGINCVAVEIVQ